jgi:hypothetical protein
LYGFDNISANNGWAMAVVGATIVFLGLVALSLAISQIHKLLHVWETRAIFFKQRKKPEPTVTEPAPPEHIPHMPAAEELALIYRPLAEQLEEPFQLDRLYERAREIDLPHPHLSIKSLRDGGILLPQGAGAFIWKK